MVVFPNPQKKTLQKKVEFGGKKHKKIYSACVFWHIVYVYIPIFGDPYTSLNIRINPTRNDIFSMIEKKLKNNKKLSFTFSVCVNNNHATNLSQRLHQSAWHGVVILSPRWRDTRILSIMGTEFISLTYVVCVSCDIGKLS